MYHQGAATLTLEQALERLPKTDQWVAIIMRRLEPYLPLRQPLKVLDVGAAQGRAWIALQRRGYEAYGVEPWGPARDVAHELAARSGVEISIRAGTAENLPFERASFDLVLAMNVMEHVISLEQSLREVYRVLRSGGMFWFSATNALCPRQNEIGAFPLFGWYPDRLKRRIMLWAKQNQPDLIGFTDTPALHWWTPWMARRKLNEVGFTTVWDRWELRHLAENTSFSERWVLALPRRIRALRLLGDMIVKGGSYAARKADSD